MKRIFRNPFHRNNAHCTQEMEFAHLLSLAFSGILGYTIDKM